MVQSQNSSVELTVKATSFLGLTTYGNMMLGNKAVEFYNERDPSDYIQIPWDEVDHVAASVMFGGRWIPRFAIFTKENGNYSFSTRENHKVLRAMRDHVGEERLVRSPTFFGVLKAGLLSLFHRGRK